MNRMMNRIGTRSIMCAAAVAAVAASERVGHAGGPLVGPQIRVDTVGGTAGANETTASASDANQQEIVAGWNDYRASGGTVRSGFSLSLDGGASWTGFLLRPPTGNQTTVEGDPMSAFDPRTGTLWAGAIAFGGNGGVYVAKKDPGAPVFEPAIMANVGGADKGWMAAGPRRNQPDTTRVFVVYNQGIMWSDDMGATWTNPQSLGAGIGFLPRIGPDGEIYVAYWDLGARVRVQRSLNDGASFTTHTVATRMDTWGTQDGSRFPGTFRAPPLVGLDVDEQTGHLYACYFDTTDMSGGNANVDVYVSKSVDQGTTWSTPQIVNADGAPAGDQFFSWLEVDAAGRVHLVYFDSRHTVQSDGVVNGMFDAYHAVSTDGGATFLESRLTPDPWNSADDGILGSTQFIGDYLGLAVAGDRGYPVYIDTSNGSAELYTNVIEFAGGCVADLDGDGEVAFADLLMLLAAWGPCGGCPEDLDDSGVVDVTDIILLLAAWGPCP